MGESFIDINNDGVWTEGELFDDVNNDGIWSKLEIEVSQEIISSSIESGVEATEENDSSITLKNVSKVASTGVKRISIGKITHSAPAINFSLEI